MLPADVMRKVPMGPEITSNDSEKQPIEITPAGAAQTTTDRIFLGPNGLRAGWRLCIFLILVAAMFAGVFRLRPLGRLINYLQPRGTMTAPANIVLEGLVVLIVLVAAAIMMKIERRSFADYGLPLNQAFGMRFWQGVPLGFVLLTALLAAIAGLHGFSFGNLALGSASALKYAALFAVWFFLVAFFEEFTFRGYLQSTLASGIGFWPAAIILAVLFGAIHLNNSGEAIMGACMAACFGFVAAFSVWRTGNIWFAIGMHAAWDWGESFFYGVPDSGAVAQGHLLNSSLHGANWLTGGTVGPEGSWLVFPVLLLMAAAIHFIFPQRSSDT
jgi:membrane protease YdiL (CAAX protease family)